LAFDLGFAQKVRHQAREAKTEPGAVATGFALPRKNLAFSPFAIVLFTATDPGATASGSVTAPSNGFCAKPFN
jgi:hypothetical protein